MNLKEKIIDSFGNIIDMVMSTLPNILTGIVLFLGALIVGSLIAKAIKKTLEGIQIDKLAEKLNDIDVMQNANIKIVPSKLVPKILYYFIVIIGALIATDIMGFEPLTELIQSLINYIPVLLSAIVYLLLGLVIANFVKNLVFRACESFGIGSGKVISMVVFLFLFIVIAISALGQAGINTDLLNSNFTLIVGGIVLGFAVAYGFAARDILTNMLSAIYSKKKFKIGQKIKVQDVEGEIVDMDNTSATIHVGDSSVMIPMKTLMSEKVTIYS